MSRDSGEEGARRRLDAVTEELLELYEEINVLYSVSRIAARSSDLAGAGRQILDEAIEVLAADAGFILYSNPDLKNEEPEPVGLGRDAARKLGAILEPRLTGAEGALVVAPFRAGAGIPGAPDAVIAAPLAAEGETLGLLCLGRKNQDRPFMAGDQKILSVLAVQAALVTAQRRNLDLTRMAKSLEERTVALQAVVAVGREISSTLDLSRVLRAIADLPAKVLKFDRCGVVVEQDGRYKLRAISDVARIDRADPSVKSLESLLAWVAARPAGFTASARSRGDDGGTVIEKMEIGLGSETEAATEFARRAEEHFESGTARAIIVIPMNDEQGQLGAIGLEASDTEPLTEAAREAALVLAHQATIAIRNGRLYKDLPLINVLESVRKGTRKVAAVPRGKLYSWLAAATVVLILSLVLSWEFRVPGKFTLHPGRKIEVVSHVDGVIRQVSDVQEGEVVEEGQVLAWLDDTDWRLRLNEAEWKLQSARRAAAAMEAEGRAADLQIFRLEAERWRQELVLLKKKIAQAEIRAPAAGILMTSRLTERTGEFLSVGSSLCTLADLSTLRARIAIDESEADSLSVPMPVPAVLKFQAFPGRDYMAVVRSIRPAAESLPGGAKLVAEAIIEGNREGLRPGMTGEARLEMGEMSLAMLAVRGPYRFVMRRIWW